METQSDQKVRVVALSNLRAMCERVSGTCHRFEVSKVSRSRVHVEYSNPDEYGNESPMVAVFPCYPTGHEFNPAGAQYNPHVVLDMLRVIGDNWDGEGWQAFQPLLDCPTLWRDGCNRWQSHGDMGVGDTAFAARDTCVVCDLPVAYEALCHACGWKQRSHDASDPHTPAHYKENGHRMPSSSEFCTKPDVIVRAIPRSEVQS